MEDREAQIRFRAMADSVPVLLWTTDARGGCTFVNRRWLEFTGRSLDAELGAGWADNLHHEDRDRCLAEFGAAFEQRQPFEMEYRLRRRDGAWRWILVRGVPYADHTGFAGFMGSGIDLTERRQAEQALHASQDQLAAAMAAGRMGTFDLDLATGRVARDRNLEELYGLEPGGASTFQDWASLIHPDDRATVLEEVARVLAEGGKYELEHRLVRPDGQVRWLERRGHAYTGDGGRVAGIRGVVVDVTDRKAAESERNVLFERVTRLQAVTAALAQAGTPDEVLEIMGTEGLRSLGASAGSVAVLDTAGRALDVAWAGGYPTELLERYGRIDLDAGVPLADAARTASPVVCTLRELGVRYPQLVDRMVGTHRAVAAFPLVVDERVIGAVGLSFDDAQPFDGARMEFLGAVVAQCAQALDRAWSYAAEASARRAAEEARARLSLLADSSRALAGSMDYEATLPEVARRAIPLLGDCCVIDVFGDDDEGPAWRRVAAADVDPQAEGKLLSIPPEAWAAADALDEADTLRNLELRSAVVVPLQARERSLGMLAMGRRNAGAFSDADRALASALGARVAQAVDNALLYRAEHLAHEEAEATASQLRFLLDVTTTLALPVPPDERLELLARQAASTVCDLCLIDLVERDGSIRRVAAAARDPAVQPLADALRHLVQADADSANPSASAIRSGLSELCPEITDARLETIATSGAHLAVVRQAQATSYVAVPLIGLAGMLGAITLIATAPSGRRYGPDDLVLAEDMATRVAMGLETASMHEEMRRVAQTLQASLLPSVPPAIPGLEVGTRYVAAEEGAVVGGDFFDVFAVGRDAWAVVVGDVCGQGVEAATVTGLARYTVRSSAIERDSPAAVLRHLNDVLLGVGAGGGDGADPRFCTVCLSRLEVTPAGASVTLSLGGHPTPYILGTDGSVRKAGRPGSLLGVMDGAEVADDHHHIGPGEALVLYTDGVTERHLGSSFFGEQGLERTLVAAAGLSADEIAGRIEEAARRFVGGQPTDDMAVVVVRVPPLVL